MSLDAADVFETYGIFSEHKCALPAVSRPRCPVAPRCMSSHAHAVDTHRRVHTCTRTNKAYALMCLLCSGMLFKLGLDFVALSHHERDVFLHRKLEDDERCFNSKRARLRRELAAMKGRDKVRRRRAILFCSFDLCVVVVVQDDHKARV